ncbi:MAG: ABC transporter permease [Dehalococcoidia bacterium]|nr:ABC transporter permease [Dehalococcoidia bacterium]
MTPPEPGASPADSAKTRSPSSLSDFFRKIFIVAGVEVLKLRHDPSELIMRAIQPALWLVVFGEVFSRMHTIPTGDLPYVDFLAPGILAQSAMFVAIFGGMSIIWERDLGIVHKFLVSPTPRLALALGKSVAGGVRALSQALIVYLLAMIMGVHINWNPINLLVVIIVVVLGAMVFTSFSLIIALLVKTRERFLGIGQVLTMPFFFASSAIYPVSVMPSWLQVLARINPLTYQVDALRLLMINGGTGNHALWLDFVVLVSATLVLTIIAGKLYPRAAI